MKEQEFNPLQGWTKEQIKSTLKAHSKSDLLKIAMQWRIAAEQLQVQLNNMECKLEIRFKSLQKMLYMDLLEVNYRGR